MPRRSIFQHIHTCSAVTRLTAIVVTGLALAGCSDEGSIIRLAVKGAFEPSVLEYGEVPVGQSKSLTVELKNTGTPVLAIDGIDLPQSFALEGLKSGLEGRSVPSGSGLEFAVAFLSAQEGEVHGVLKVTSGETVVTLGLHAIGVIRRAPMLSLEPTSLDFGVVEIGTEARKPFTVRNAGTAPGTIDRVSLSSTGMDIRPGDEYRLDWVLPLTVAPGTSVVLETVFNPAQEGQRPDKMLLGTSGAGAPLELSLNGQGRVANGEILCEPSSIDFGRVERGQAVMRELSCSARGGPSRLISADMPPADMYFAMLAPPPPTDLAVNASVRLQVEYRPEGLPMVHTSALTVRYDGPRGPATVVVPLSGEVIPPPPTATAISIVQHWDRNFTDVDLHLVRPGGMAFGFNDSDCYYADRSPDWGVQSSQVDDPFLDVDDVDGFGPETINLNQAAPGAYEVLIHYFSDHSQGDTTATVEVYMDGSLAGTFMRNLTCDDLWNVGTVNWTGTSGTFSPSNMVIPASGHGVCQ